MITSWTVRMSARKYFADCPGCFPFGAIDAIERRRPGIVCTSSRKTSMSSPTYSRLDAGAEAQILIANGDSNTESNVAASDADAKESANAAAADEKGVDEKESRRKKCECKRIGYCCDCFC